MKIQRITLRHFPAAGAIYIYLSAGNTNLCDQTYQVTVSGILDGHDTDSVELTSGSTEVDIGTVVVVDIGLGA